jgi:hypothetical protein
MPALISRFVWPALLCAGTLHLSSLPIQAQSLVPEPLGQSSRRTSLVISEIMYNPLDRLDGRNLEFVELFNSLSTPEDISGWRLDGDADFTFRRTRLFRGADSSVLRSSPRTWNWFTASAGVLGPLSNTNSLPNTRARFSFATALARFSSRLVTTPKRPGRSRRMVPDILCAGPAYGEGNAEAWAASDAVGARRGGLIRSRSIPSAMS